jgi:hypothetical protein
LTSEREKEFSKAGGLLALWAGVLVGPAVWLLQFQTNYTLVPLTCNHGGKWALHTVSVAALLLTAGAGALAWSNWRDAGGGARQNEGAGVVPRSRFMSVLGLLVSSMFFLVILAQWIASWVFGPCQW